MTSIDLSKYGPVVSTESVGQEIYDLIHSALENDGDVTVNMEGIITMATFCAKQIFGKLYLDMGADQFFQNIVISNATENVRSTIRTGILYSIKGI